MITKRIWDMINAVEVDNGMIQIFFCVLILWSVFFINKLIRNNIQSYADYKYNNFAVYIFVLMIILGYYIFSGYDTVVLIFAGVIFCFWVIKNVLIKWVQNELISITIIVLYWVIVIDFARDQGFLKDFWDLEIFSVDNQKIDFYTILLFLITTLFGLIVCRSINKFLRRKIAQNIPKGIGMREILYRILASAVYFVFFLLALRFLNFSIQSFVFILSGLSVGIGFSLREVLGHFFAGIVMVLEKTVKIGDIIEPPDKRGYLIIKEINLRHVVAENLAREKIIIPNEWFLKNNYKNLSTGGQKFLQISIETHIRPQQDPQKAKGILDEILFKYNLHEEKIPRSRLAQITPYSLMFKSNLWVASDTDSSVAALKESVMLNILYEFKKNKIELCDNPFISRF